MKNRNRHRTPRRSAEEARTFTTASVNSIMQVQAAIDARRADGIHVDCACEPYTDTFTFGRWADQDLIVKKGEKALKIATFTPTGGKYEVEGEGGEKQEMKRLRPVTANLFCRCQVQSREAAALAKAAQDAEAAPLPKNVWPAQMAAAQAA